MKHDVCCGVNRAFPSVLVGLLVAAVVMGLTPGVARGQAQDNCGVAGAYNGEAGFQIDGQFYSGPDGDDWAQGTSYDGVILLDGTPDTINFDHVSWKRDPNSLSSATDPTVFRTACENGDQIGVGQDPWGCKDGNNPPKNDLSDLFAHSRGPFVTSLGDTQFWIFLGATTLSTNGDSHVDIEWNLAGIETTTDASDNCIMVGLGPHDGRTAGSDFIVSADYVNGGRNVQVTVRKWTETSPGVYEFVIIPTDTTAVFVCADYVGVEPPPWGAADSDGVVIYPPNTLGARQFVEIGVNLAAMGIDLTNLCGADATLMFKTRSSASFTAQLKDFGLIPFPLFPEPPCDLVGDEVCAGDEATVQGPVEPAEESWNYYWSGPGSFTDHGDHITVTHSVAGTYTYTLVVEDDLTKCISDTCEADVIVYANPVCTIEGQDELCADTGTSGYIQTYTMGCDPSVDTWSWSFVGSTDATFDGPTNGMTVDVRVRTQDFTLKCDVVDIHGDPGDPDAECPGTDELIVHVYPNPNCPIIGTTEFCAPAEAPFYYDEVYCVDCPTTDGFDVRSHDWSFVGSTSAEFVSATDDSCVTVRIYDEGFILKCHVEDTYSQGDGVVCDGDFLQTVNVYPNPNCTMLGDTLLCAAQNPAVGYTTTYEMSCDLEIDSYAWSIVPPSAADIESGQGTHEVTVRIYDQSFQINCNASIDYNGVPTRLSCGTSDALDVTVFPNPDCSISGVLGICENIEDVPFRSDCSPFVISTYSWSFDGATDATFDGPTDRDSVLVDVGTQDFTLELYVLDANGCDSTFTHPVTVYPNPECDIVGPDSLCLQATVGNLTYCLRCPGFDMDEWLWEITSGGAVASIVGSATDSCAEVAIAQAGQFTIKCTFEDINDCPGTAEYTVDIWPDPVCSISGVTEICADAEDVPFRSDCSPYEIDTYTWSFLSAVDATFDGPTDRDSVLVDVGSYNFTLQLHVVDTKGCDSTFIHPVTVHLNPECDIMGPDSLCLQATVGNLTYNLHCGEFTDDEWLWEITAGGDVASIVGSTTSSTAEVAIAKAGQFTIKCTFEDVNDCPGTAEYTVNIWPDPVCSISGPDPVCENVEDQEYCASCAPFEIATYSWSFDGSTDATFDGATNDSCVVVDVGIEDFTLELYVVDTKGCDSTFTYPVTVLGRPPCTISGPEGVCESELPDTLWGPEEPVDPQISYRYDWSGPHTGIPTARIAPGKNDRPIERPVVWPDQRWIEVNEEGLYKLLVTAIYADYEGHECASDTCSHYFSVYANPTCLIEPPDTLPTCGTAGHKLSVPDTFKTYQWELLCAPPGWEITDGDTTHEITYTAGDHAELANPESCDCSWAWFRLYVTDFNDCPGECEVCFTCEPPGDEFCTFTQGFYGNYGGKKNGEDTIDIIRRLITPADPLIIGVQEPGASWFSIRDGDEDCVIARLPAGGPSITLPDGLAGPMAGPDTCQTDPAILLKRGRFRNNLLGQTIALSLNARYDDNLGSLGICETMVSQAALCVNDICGDDDDVPDPADTTFVTRTIPSTVFAALDSLGLSRTVGGLLDLANLALAGELEGDPRISASLSQIGGAAGSINELFDECRFLIACTNAAPTKPVVAGGTSPEKMPTAFSLSPALPNPMTRTTTINYAVPERSRVRMTLYNVAGRRVAVLMDGVVDPGRKSLAVDLRDYHRISAGVYFLRMEATGLETRKGFIQAQKMLVLR